MQGSFIWKDSSSTVTGTSLTDVTLQQHLLRGAHMVAHGRVLLLSSRVQNIQQASLQKDTNEYH